MKLKRQAWWSGTVSGYRRLSRVAEALVGEETGVTSIEYALLGSLIAIAAVTGIALLGGEVRAMWTRVADAVIAVM